MTGTRVAIRREFKANVLMVFPNADALRAYNPGRDFYTVAELPEGDWRMTKFGDKIMFADSSGNSPAMTVDANGNSEVL